MVAWIAGSVFGVVVVGVVALALLSFRPGAGQVEVEVRIERPSPDVWRHLTEPELVKGWVGGLVEIEPLNGTELVVGARDRMVVQMGSSRGEMLSEITAVEPGKRLSQRVVSGPGAPMTFEEEMTFSLEEVDVGTRVRLSATSRHTGIGRLFEPLLTFVGRKKLTQDVQRLKTNVESSGSP